MVRADDPTAASPVDSQKRSKKEAQMRAKARAAGRESERRSNSKRRRSKRAASPLWAYSLHSREILILDDPAAPSAAAINAFFRCRTTTQQATIPPELIARILEAAEHFDAAQVMVVSGYRSPKFNLSLRKKGRQVAAKSQHTLGHAIDFYLPGVPVQKLYRWLREHHDGGVGFYPVSEFVHIDTGRKRTWRGT